MINFKELDNNSLTMYLTDKMQKERNKYTIALMISKIRFASNDYKKNNTNITL